MSEILIEKIIFFEAELKSKENIITETKDKILEQSRTIELLKMKLQHKEREIEIISRDFQNLNEVINEQNAQIQHITQINQTLTKEIQSLKDSKTPKQDHLSINSTKSDLNLIRMQYSDLEANFLRTQEKMMCLCRSL